MKSLMVKGLVFSIVLGLFISPFLVDNGVAQVKEKKININTASSAELQKLPRVGEKIAQRIIDYRKANGRFRKIEEIMKVKGIGEKTFKRIKNLISV